MNPATQTNGFSQNLEPSRVNPTPPTVSGRAVVIASLGTLGAVAGLLYVLFLLWAMGTRAKIEEGKQVLLPVLDPLAERLPSGVSPQEWAEALDATRAMLAEVVGTGQLDRPSLIKLRTELEARVRRSTPDTAPAELAGLWDDMERLKGRWRSRIAQRRPALLAGKAPIISNAGETGKNQP